MFAQPEARGVSPWARAQFFDQGAPAPRKRVSMRKGRMVARRDALTALDFFRGRSPPLAGANYPERFGFCRPAGRR